MAKLKKFTVLLTRPYGEDFDDLYYWAQVEAADAYAAIPVAKIQLYKADQKDFELDRNQRSKEIAYRRMQVIGVLEGHTQPVLYQFSSGVNN